MEGRLTMSRKELDRKSVLELVALGQLSLVEASERMNLSYRQTLRVYQRFREAGDAGLVHRGRGTPSNRAYPPRFRKKVLKRYRERYAPHGLGPTLAAEKLAEDGLAVDHDTLRRWLVEEGLWLKRRKRRVHRCRRERRAHFGELVQMDGSHHRWFGENKGPACLMNMVDDATGTTLGLMDHQETTEAAMNLLRRWIEKYGVPRALYTDKKTVYLTSREPTLEEQLAGEEPMTAFGKACKKLGIEIIAAHSPQAKGRVERSNGIYQDRLVKELAMRGITTCAAADRLLEKGFSDSLNAKFAVAPLEEKDYHRPLPRSTSLDDVFCFEEHRVVQNDWCVRYENRYLQILEENRPLPRPKDKVLVRTRLDGSVHVLFEGKTLAYRRLTPAQLRRWQRGQKCAPRASPKKTNHSKPQRPAENHPWRHGCSHMRNEPGK